MAADRGLTRSESRTAKWLEERFADAAPDGRLVYEQRIEPRFVTQEHFGRLLRQLRLVRWLDRFRFDSLIDVGSGWAFFPWLVRNRYKSETFYCDFVHRWNLPTDLWELHKVDHAVTAKLPQLPFPDAAFDVVVCSEVLEHLVHPVEALAELVRVAKRYVLFTSLEALSPGRFRRWLDHHRVDFSIPHVERNYLLLGEFRAIMGDGFHSECFEYQPDMPAHAWQPAEERERAYAGLRDREALGSALCQAARVTGHQRGTMGIVGVKVLPGASVDDADPTNDRERADWLIDHAARHEQLSWEALAGAGAIQHDPSRTPWYLKDRERAVHADLLARLCCPDCRATLTRAGGSLECSACGRTFKSEYGVPMLYAKDVEPRAELMDDWVRRLCGSDGSRAGSVRRLMQRLHNNEDRPSRWRRKLAHLLAR